MVCILVSSKLPTFPPNSFILLNSCVRSLLCNAAHRMNQLQSTLINQTAFVLEDVSEEKHLKTYRWNRTKKNLSKLSSVVLANIRLAEQVVSCIKTTPWQNDHVIKKPSEPEIKWKPSQVVKTLPNFTFIKAILRIQYKTQHVCEQWERDKCFPWGFSLL